MALTSTAGAASSSSAPAALSPPPAHEVSPLDDESFTAFESFCIVCDRVIKPPKEKEPVKLKKKCPAGTIRVKNPDGTVTTRTANGQKTTRPPLRRGPSSNSRLAVACANNAATKLAPLTQANAAGGGGSDEVCLDTPAGSAGASKTPSPRAPAGSRLSSGATATAEPPFASAVYCSRACAQVEEARSNDAVRRVSFGHPSPRSLGIITSGLGFSDPRKSPYGPPSPLFISGSSDSSSNTDAPLSAVDSGPACSAPTAMEFFRMTREGPDDAWREVNRQRRSSVHPNSRPNEMIRQLSQASTALSGEPSSDSLSSMWQPDDNGYFSRPASGSGKMRVLPLPEQYLTHHRGSTSSDRGSAAVPTASRPIPRSGLSQVSLTASSPGNAGADLPAEFGSAPQHTLSLWNNYHASFPSRDSISSSASSHKAYTQPGTYSPVMSPPSGAFERKNSMGSGLSRPLGGTIRAKSRTDVTWDSFGREEIMARSRRASTRAATDGELGVPDHTPKQSVETATGASAWPEKYVAPPGISAALNRDGTIRSKSRASFRSTRSTTSDDESSAQAGPASFSQRASFSHQGAIGAGSQGLPIPLRQPSASALSISPVPVHANASSGRTPRNSVPRHNGSPALLSTSSSSAAVPDLASLRIGTTGACVAAAGATAAPGSAPKAQTLGNYNWDEFERKGGKTYELPKALKVNPNKAGLFFFPTK